MSRGIYICADDRALDQSLALLASLRAHDPEVPVVLIPYSPSCRGIAATLARGFGVTVLDDGGFLQRLDRHLRREFGAGFFPRPRQFHKQACWIGPLDEFLYLDTDLVVFEPIADLLDHLADHDFVCADYQHRGGLDNVFTADAASSGALPPGVESEVFNGGLWGSRKGSISEAELFATLSECARRPELFDYSHGVSDQPILNYLVLTRLSRRINLAHGAGEPGSWAGSPHFERRGDRLFDRNAGRELRYLHWAGISLRPGCPYWDLWRHFRELAEASGGAQPPAPGFETSRSSNSTTDRQT